MSRGVDTHFCGYRSTRTERLLCAHGSDGPSVPKTHLNPAACLSVFAPIALRSRSIQVSSNFGRVFQTFGSDRKDQLRSFRASALEAHRLSISCIDHQYLWRRTVLKYVPHIGALMNVLSSGNSPLGFTAHSWNAHEKLYLPKEDLAS